MSDAVSGEVIARVERALEEAYSRFAGLGEAERVDGLAEALQRALAAEPEAQHRTLLDQLDLRYAAPASPKPSSETTDEIAALRAEVDRLRAQLAQVPPPPPPADHLMLEALLGEEAKKLTGATDPARLVAIVRSLAAFATAVVRTALASPTEAGDSIVQVDKLKRALKADAAGSGAAGATQGLLDEAKLHIVIQRGAFQVACVRGGRQLLREIAPGVLKGAGGVQFFKVSDWWNDFEAKHAALEAKKDDEFFQEFFQATFANACIILLREAQGKAK